MAVFSDQNEAIVTSGIVEAFFDVKDVWVTELDHDLHLKVCFPVIYGIFIFFDHP